MLAKASDHSCSVLLHRIKKMSPFRSSSAALRIARALLYSDCDLLNGPRCRCPVATARHCHALISVLGCAASAFSTCCTRPFPIGDDSITGQTDEDRFFGARSPQGISKIRIQHSAGTGRELDHVQFSVDTIFANGFE
jgi:hypothetical protein